MLKLITCMAKLELELIFFVVRRMYTHTQTPIHWKGENNTLSGIKQAKILQKDFEFLKMFKQKISYEKTLVKIRGKVSFKIFSVYISAQNMMGTYKWIFFCNLLYLLGCEQIVNSFMFTDIQLVMILECIYAFFYYYSIAIINIIWKTFTILLNRYLSTWKNVFTFGTIKATELT